LLSFHNKIQKAFNLSDIPLANVSVVYLYLSLCLSWTYFINSANNN